MDKEYIKLIEWLIYYDESDVKNIGNYAHLVVSKKLLNEYNRSNQNAESETSILLLIIRLQAENRLVEISNKQIKQFKAAHFSKKVIRTLRCNNEDRDHIPVVLLSERKYALSNDDNFAYDLVNFPGFNARVEKRPGRLPYSK